MLLAACGSGGANSDDDGTGTGERAGARSAGAGGGTLVVVGSGAVPSLDKEAALVPAQQEVLVNAYEPLLRFAPTELATFQLVPVGDPASFVSGLCSDPRRLLPGQKKSEEAPPGIGSDRRREVGTTLT